MGKSLKEVFDFKSTDSLPVVHKTAHSLFKKSDRVIIHDKDYGYTIGYLYQYNDNASVQEGLGNGNIFATETDVYLLKVTAWAYLPKKAPTIDNVE